VKRAIWSLLPSFRKRKGSVWIVDGTFIHVHGDSFELAEYGHDSTEGKLNPGYLLLNVFDMATKKPVYWLLMPGNASEMKLFPQVLTEAMEASAEKPGIVVFDRGFLSHDNLNFLKREGIRWVTQAETKMKVSSKNRYLAPREWFEYYEMGKSREVYWKGYGAMLMAKDEEIRNGKLISWRVIIGSPELTPGQIISLYNKRWAIEEYHKQLRALGLNVLPTGRFDGLKLHVLLVVLAYLLLHAAERILRCIGKSVVTIIRRICVAGFVAGLS
jgi:transposase